MGDVHLPAETIARLLSEEMTPEESAASEAHLRVCAACRAKLDEETAMTLAVSVALAPPNPQPSLLTAAPPNFELIRLLGVGKTASVYQARQLSMGRIVALKFLSGGWPSAAEAQRRFQAEIEVAASQNHPHIVQVFEVGTHQGHPFLVMEFCAGGSLAERLRDGPLPPRQAAALIELLARTLHTVHTNGFVHRDLKPANILFDADHRPKIADFGVVKRLDTADTPTPVGSILGTPPYLAPEQIDNSAPAGSPCDVYALGAILYECLIGRPPFRADSVADILYDVLSREPLPPRLANPRLPRDLETICLKCLEKEPARRYGSALEFAEDLSRFLNGQAVRARPVRLPGRTWRWLRRNPAPALLSSALILTVAVGLALCGRLWYQAVVSQQETEAARREAEANFLRTRRLLPELVEAGNGPARQEVERQRIRRATLERADSLYRELCWARPDDVELRSEWAHVLTALAAAALTEGRYKEADAAAEEARRLWRCLLDAAPREPRWRAGEARALLHLAIVRKLLGRSREMADAYHEAIALLQGLSDERPRDTGILLETVAARQELSASLYEQGKIGESQSQLEENRRQLEAYRAAGFDAVAVRLALVKTLCRLGQRYQVRGDAQAASRCWREGLRHSAGLDISLPQDPHAWYCVTVCALWLPRGDPDAVTPAQAIPRLEQVIQILEIAHVLNAESDWSLFAQVARCLADCYLDAGRPAEALRMERRAAEALPRPDGSPYLDLVHLEGIACLARRERRAGQTVAARRHAQEVADGFETLCRTHAADAALRKTAVDFCPRLAAPLRHAGAAEQSRRIARCALQLEQRAPDTDGAAHLRRLSEIWAQLAKCRMRDDSDGVEAALRQALELARRLIAVSPQHRFLLDERLARLARWLAEHGQRRQAAECLRERKSLWVRDADGLRGVARAFRELANGGKSGRNVRSTEEEAESDGFLAEAVRLEKAAAALRR